MSRITPLPAALHRGSVLAAIAQRGDDQHRLAMDRIDALLYGPTAPRLFEDVASLPELLERGRKDRDLVARAWAPMYERSIADQTTANSPGAVPPTWLAEAFGIQAAARPAIQAFGGPRDAGEQGMSVDYPVRTSTELSVGLQAGEKTQATSARVDIGSADEALGSFFGVADISLQLLRRSSGPGYRQVYSEALISDHGRVTDAAFAAALVAGGTVADAGWDADTSGRSLLEALLAASAQVQEASGVPATFAIAATDIWTQLPRLEAVVGPGTTGSAGRIDAPGLGPIIHVPGLPTGHLVVSTPSAAGWVESPPLTIEAAVPGKIGTDLAWGTFATAAIFVPGAVVKLYGPGASGS